MSTSTPSSSDREFTPSTLSSHTPRNLPSREFLRSLSLVANLALTTCGSVESTGNGGSGTGGTGGDTNTITVPCDTTEWDHPLTQEEALTYCGDVKEYLAKHPECDTAILEVCFGISDKLMRCGIGNEIFCDNPNLTTEVNTIYDNGGNCEPAFVQIADASCPSE